MRPDHVVWLSWFIGNVMVGYRFDPAIGIITACTTLILLICWWWTE